MISATIEQHGGRVVNYAGDAVLAEFGAVLDAISSAIEIQGELKIRNEGQPEDESVQFRIGLNLGDVIEDRGDIYGDGVNVAARLEGLAEPGGICISESIRTAVANRLPIGYEFLGEREVKNIAEPVRAYKVVAEPVQLGNSEPVPPPLSDLTLPSVAVLPFTNMSGDPEQEYFGDGVAEDIITALSKVRNMMVIARNSSFIYKGAPVDVKQVGREQGVRYVLEGSVRRSGNRLRITAQLIDAESAHYLWSERYDRLAEDVFDVQDEITREVTAALQVELTQGEQARLWASGTKHLEAWELAVQGRFLVDSHHRDSVRKSQQLTQRAVQLDENYANAWSILAQTYWSEALNKGWNESREVSLSMAKEAAEKACACDPASPDAQITLALVNLSNRNHAKALALAERAVSLAPSHAHVSAIASIVFVGCGKLNEAIGLVRKAIQHCPVYPVWYRTTSSRAYWAMLEPEKAESEARLTLELDPRMSYGYVVLAKSLVDQGRIDEAKQAAAAALEIDPDFSIRFWVDGMPYEDPALTDRQVQALLSAGLPD